MWIRIRVSAVGSSENARNASTLFCLVFPRGLSDVRMNDKLFLKFSEPRITRIKRMADCAERQRGKRRGESGCFALGASPFSQRNGNSAVTISHRLAAVRCVSPYRVYAISESRPKNVESVSLRSGAQATDSTCNGIRENSYRRQRRKRRSQLDLRTLRSLCSLLLISY